MAGEVRVGKQGRRAAKPGELLDAQEELSVEQAPAYVSRGGIKLANALASSRVEVAGRGALDVGASTGGFTDCLLQRGARAVIAVDVGYGALAWSLRGDPRVHVMERTNARALTPEMLAYRARRAIGRRSYGSRRPRAGGATRRRSRIWRARSSREGDHGAHPPAPAGHHPGPAAARATGGRGGRHPAAGRGGDPQARDRE